MPALFDPTLGSTITLRYGYDPTTMVKVSAFDAKGGPATIALSVGGADAVLTSGAAHGMATGRYVKLTGFTTTPDCNSTQRITVLSGTTFSINLNVTDVHLGPTGTYASNDSGGFNRLIGWTAVAGSEASNDFGVAGNAKLPGHSSLGGEHASFGGWYNDHAVVSKNSGTQFNPGDATGVGCIGVFSAPFGSVNGLASDIALYPYEAIVIFGIPTANTGCCGFGINRLTRELVMFAGNAGVAAATVVGTGMYLQSDRTALGFYHTSAGWKIYIKDFGTATGNALCTSWTNPSAYLAIGTGAFITTNLTHWSGGGVWAFYAYSGNALATGTNLTQLVDNLATAYDQRMKTGLIAVTGDSIYAGQQADLGEPVCAHIAEQNPTYRVICLARGGRTSTDEAANVASLTTTNLYTGLTGRKFVLTDALSANEALLGTYVAGTYQTNMTTCFTAWAGAGYTIMVEPPLPLTNKSGVDTDVVIWQNIRIGVEAYLRSLTTITVLDTTLHEPWKVDLTGASTAAQKAGRERAVTQSRNFETAVQAANMDDPTSRTGNDEIHPGNTLASVSRSGIVARTIVTLTTSTGRVSNFRDRI